MQHRHNVFKQQIEISSNQEFSAEENLQKIEKIWGNRVPHQVINQNLIVVILKSTNKVWLEISLKKIEKIQGVELTQPFRG